MWITLKKFNDDLDPHPKLNFYHYTFYLVLTYYAL